MKEKLSLFFLSQEKKILKRKIEKCSTEKKVDDLITSFSPLGLLT